MTGKAVPRALRTLSLTEAGLMFLFLLLFVEEALDDDKNENKISRINQLMLYDKLILSTRKHLLK